MAPMTRRGRRYGRPVGRAMPVLRWPSWSSIASSRVPSAAVRGHDHPRSGQVGGCTPPATGPPRSTSTGPLPPVDETAVALQPSERFFLDCVTTATGNPRGDRPARGSARTRTTSAHRGGWRGCGVSSRRARRLSTRGAGCDRVEGERDDG